MLVQAAYYDFGPLPGFVVLTLLGWRCICDFGSDLLK